MNYIVVDFEWNQPRFEQKPIREPFYFDSEIIEFGAVKLDENFKPISEFRKFVRQVFYPTMNGKVARLTRISTSDVVGARDFVDVFDDFCNWCGDEYALMTWGPTDVPVLMENMIMHGLPVDQMPVCYDLQRIFTREVMRMDGQCSLENAVAALNLTADRAHDALNDARNTARICGFLDLDEYMEEYRTCYVDYEQAEVDHAIHDNEERTQLGTFTCPYCGEQVSPHDPWVFGHSASACATCSDGEEFLVSLYHSRIDDTHYIYKRIVIEMNDDIWDFYANKCDLAGQAV